MIALFFDTETTGFKTGDYIPGIVQIGAILQDTKTRRELAVLSLIVHPGMPVPPESTAIHGIDDQMIASFGMNSSIIEVLFTDLVIRADSLVAHNIEFDVGIIKDAWPHAYAAFEGKELYDTMELTMPVLQLPKSKTSSYHNDKYPDFKAPRLTEAYQHYFGKDFVGAHSALADASACRDVYFALQDSLELTDA